MSREAKSTIRTDAEARNARLPRPGKSRAEYRDERTPGLVLRVTGNNVRSWVYWLKNPNTGSWAKLTLGRYADGRPGHVSFADARELAARLRGTENPFSQRNAERLTVKELGEKYIERHAKPKKRSWTEDERRLKKHIYPKLGSTFIEKVTRSDIANLLHKIQTSAPIEANRTLSLLRKVFKFAIGQGDLELSPVTYVPAPAKERARSRTLSEPEIKTFWLALGGLHFSDVTADALRLALLLGARIGEITGIPECELELDASPPLWRLPAERSKTSTEIVRPLPPVALSILQQRLAAKRELQKQRKIGRRNPFLLVTELAPDSGLTPRAAWRALDRAQSDKRVDIAKDFTVHDLRRTCRTGFAKLRVPETVAKKILGHTPPRSDVTASVYDQHTYQPEMYAALRKWERHLLSIVSK